MVYPTTTTTILVLIGCLCHGVEAVGPSPLLLRSAANYAILAKSGIDTVPPSSIFGNIAVSPISGSAITGFSEVKDTFGTFAVSSQVIGGRVFAADYNSPTPGLLTTAVGDMEAAYVDGATRGGPNFIDVGASGDIGGLSLSPGLYSFSTSVSVSTEITLTGGASDTWIFQIPGTMTIATGVHVRLAGGAIPQNIFWVIAGAVTYGVNSHQEGQILGATSITMQTSSSIMGCLYAQTAVTLDQASVICEKAVDVPPPVSSSASVTMSSAPVTTSSEVPVVSSVPPTTSSVTTNSSIPPTSTEISITSSSIPVASSVESSSVPITSSVQLSSILVTTSVQSSSIPVTSLVQSTTVSITSSIQSSSVPITSSIQSSSIPVASSVQSTTVPVTSSVQSTTLPITSSVQSTTRPSTSFAQSSSVPVTSWIQSSSIALTSSVRITSSIQSFTSSVQTSSNIISTSSATWATSSTESGSTWSEYTKTPCATSTSTSVQTSKTPCATTPPSTPIQTKSPCTTSTDHGVETPSPSFVPPHHEEEWSHPPYPIESPPPESTCKLVRVTKTHWATVTSTKPCTTYSFETVTHTKTRWVPFVTTTHEVKPEKTWSKEWEKPEKTAEPVETPCTTTIPCSTATAALVETPVRRHVRGFW